MTAWNNCFHFDLISINAIVYIPYACYINVSNTLVKFVIFLRVIYSIDQLHQKSKSMTIQFVLMYFLIFM